MEIFQIAAFAMVSVILVSLLKDCIPSYGIICLLACSIGLCIYILQLMEPIIIWVHRYSAYINHDSFFMILKAGGIAIVAQTTQDLCKDAGMHTLASKIELAGRCLLLVCALPLFESILESLVTFL